jgi:hypothetical protein
MYEKGESLNDIAKHFKCSRNKVRDALLKAKIKLRPNVAIKTGASALKPYKQSSKLYYGFCYFEGQVIKDPREFPTLLLIHKRWSDGRTAHEIVQELNQASLPSRTNKKWSWKTISNILTRFKQKKIKLEKGGKYELR